MVPAPTSNSMPSYAVAVLWLLAIKFDCGDVNAPKFDAFKAVTTVASANAIPLMFTVVKANPPLFVLSAICSDVVLVVVVIVFVET